MSICSKIGGFTMKEADDVRRAMGKKKKEVLDAYKEQFIKGAEAQGISRGYAGDLWSTLVGFADYCLAGDTPILVRAHNPNRKFSLFAVDYETTIEKIVKDKPSDTSIQTSEGFQPIVQFHDQGEKETFTYTFEDGSVVTCTPDHKFMVKDGSMLPIEQIFQEGLELHTT